MCTIENNKLIAEFINSPKIHQIDLAKDTLVSYNSSWDWLMPVVEQIEGLNPSGDRWIVEVEGISCRIYSTDIELEFEKCTSSKLNSTYKAVVEFIKWYNLNK